MKCSKWLIAVTCAFCCLVPFSTAQADLKLGDGAATGQWWNAARSGEGFWIEIIDVGGNLQVGVAMYSFDEEGNQLWLAGNVPIEASAVAAEVPVVLIEGPLWGTQFDPADADTTQFGSIVVRFPSCDTALFSVESNVAGLESGSYSLVRATSVVGTDCVDQPTQPPTQEGSVTPGLWTGLGGCFFVNAEGTRLLESDLCDEGKALSAEAPGVKIDIDGKWDPDGCQANVVCDGSWPISYGDSVVVSCVNDLGGLANIYFNSATDAQVEAWEDGDDFGDSCVGAFNATPAE